MAAKRLARRIRERVENLPQHPLSGRRVPEFPERSYREVVVPPYRIIYDLLDSHLVILRVWHSSRDMHRFNPTS